MSVNLLFILVLISFIFLLMRHRKMALSFLGLALLWLTVTGIGIFPRLLLSTLQTYPQIINPHWKESNVIVLLGAGIYKWEENDSFLGHPLGESRVLETARLYFLCRNQGLKCKIIATGGDLHNKGMSEAKVIQNELIGLGVTEADIILEERSNNTYENAQYSMPILTSLNFDQIIVVTSGFHLLRSQILFSHFNIAAIWAPSDYLNTSFSLLPRGNNLYWMDLALHEYGGIAKFHIFKFFDWKY